MSVPNRLGFSTEKTVGIGEFAVKTGMFVLAEAEHGQVKITTEISERLPVAEYLKLQRRFAHLKDEDMKMIQGLVDKYYASYMKLTQT